jgi:phosphoglycolate phosphatase (TIGR01487 family)
MNFESSQSLAASLPEELPPLVVDIDGTLTDRSRAVDPRTFPVLRSWPSALVIATGKAMPYPVSLCEFLGIEPIVVAENGGVVVVGPTDTVSFQGDREGAAAVLSAYREAGYDPGWGLANLSNRWRETELIVRRDAPLDPLEEIAAQHGLTVVDTGFAYHVKSPDFDKGGGVGVVARELGLDAGEFVAIGDSTNDTAAFDVADLGIAVGNADDAATAAADHVTDGRYADGFLEGVELLVSGR